MRTTLVFFSYIVSLWIAQVAPKLPDPDWFMKGGLDDQEAASMMEEDDGNKFFYQKWSVNVFFQKLLFDFLFMVQLFKGLNLKKGHVIPTQLLDPSVTYTTMFLCFLCH